MIKNFITKLIRKLIEPACIEIIKDCNDRDYKNLKEMTKKLTEKHFHIQVTDNEREEK